MQTAYAYLHREEQKLSVAEADLKTSLGRSYDLYLFLLRLPIDITDFLSELVELRKNKHLASREERNPDYKLLKNKYVEKLRECVELDNWYNQFPLAWSEESILLRSFIKDIENSDIYREYLKSPDSFEADRDFWANVFQHIIAPSELLAHYLEEQSIYWDDSLVYIEKVECEEKPSPDSEDIKQVIEVAKVEKQYQAQRYENGNVEIVKSFVHKTMKRLVAEDEFASVLLPQYRDSEDALFAQHLLRQTILSYDKAEELIAQNISEKWEKERLADMDRLILHLAITEFLHFPTIPTQISINEYVELSKHYSTPRSSAFVNGVLDAVAKNLKAEGKIIKR